MKNIKNKLVISIALSLFVFNTACTQTLHSSKDIAQKLINQAGGLMMNQRPEINRNNDLRQAIVLLEKSIKQDSTLDIAYSSLISCYLELGERAKAIDVCSLWLREKPNDDSINYKRGMLYYTAGNTKLAEADFAIVNEKLSKTEYLISSNLAKSEIDNIVNKAYIYMVIGKYEEGLDLMKRLKVAFPTDGDLESKSESFRNASRDNIIEQLTGVR